MMKFYYKIEGNIQVRDIDELLYTPEVIRDARENLIAYGEVTNVEFDSFDKKGE